MIPTMQTKIKAILGIETIVLLVILITLIVVITTKCDDQSDISSISVEESEFGHTSSHEIVKKYTLRKGDDFVVELLSYGAAIKAIHAKCKHGHLNNRVLGFNTISGNSG